MKKTYFHCSDSKFLVGEEIFTLPSLCGKNTGGASSPTEAFLDSHKPEGKLSRLKSLFITDNPDTAELLSGGGKFIYEVEPIGKTQKHCVAYANATKVALVDMESLSVAKDMALCYWESEGGEFDPDNTEYLCSGFIVKGVCE